MDTRLTVLKLFLDKLEISDDITTVDDRKRVQKAVYLGQVLAGVDLGYRFGWYVMGPYSPDLTKDYYSLAEAIATGDKEFEAMELVELAAAKLESIKHILDKPSDFRRSRESWLELIASYHYLRKISGFDDAKAGDIFKNQKPHLEPYLDIARRVLQESNMLS